MKMELIQPFINAADAVLAQALQCADDHRRRHHGRGSLSPQRRCRPWCGHRRHRRPHDLRSRSPDRGEGGQPDGGSRTARIRRPGSRETACELANQDVGNASLHLNDQGFHFRVHPPAMLLPKTRQKTEDTEALVICFETPIGNVFMNIAIRYNRKRQGDRAAAAGN